MTCASCGTQNPDNARFCMSCGASLAPACPSCGTENPAGAKFCIECGTRARGARHRPAAGREPARGAAQGDDRLRRPLRLHRGLRAPGSRSGSRRWSTARCVVSAARSSATAGRSTSTSATTSWASSARRSPTRTIPSGRSAPASRCRRRWRRSTSGSPPTSAPTSRCGSGSTRARSSPGGSATATR